MIKLPKKPRFTIPKSLFFFIFISFSFWMLSKLSKTYESDKIFELRYINLPTNKLLQNEPLKESKLKLEGSGFRLFATYFSNKKIDIDVKPLLKTANSRNYILMSDQKKSIENQLRKEVKIASFSNDTIYFDFGYLASKKLPVKPNYKVSYKTGYDLLDSIKFSPDSITISGPEKTIDTLEYVDLQTVDLKEVEKNIYKNVKVKEFKNLKNVTIVEKTVLMTGNVDKFTEGDLEIPITIINLPQDVQITTFPKTVKVIYRVGLKNFNKVDDSSFAVICDYSYSQKNSLSYLVPELKINSEFSSNEKISPKKIDFLIQK